MRVWVGPYFDTFITSPHEKELQPNGMPYVDKSFKVSGNSGSFPNHDNAESGGSSHMHTIQDSIKSMKCIIENNNASDAVTVPYKKAKLK